MQIFKTIFQFEFAQLAKKKVQIIVTVTLMLVMLVASFVPRLFNTTQETSSEPTASDVFADAGFVFENDAVRAAFSMLVSPNIMANRDRLNDSLERKDLELGFVVSSPTQIEIIGKKAVMDHPAVQALQDIALGVARDARLRAAGLDPQTVNQAQQVDMTINYTVLDSNEVPALALAMGILFMLYMMLLLYGQLVATAVAREKDSRTMELLITSTKPKTLIVGKVAAVGVFSVLQIMMIMGSFLLGYVINQSGYPPLIRTLIAGSMSWDVILVYGLFSLSGYILYLFIYAAMGSLVSKVEDVGSAIGPITFLFVIAYLIATLAMSFPNSTIVVVSSFIPFVSLFTMPIRYMLVGVAVSDLAIALVIMALTSYLCARLSIYIYSFGSLNYGNKLKLKDIFKAMVQPKNTR